jgi:hypothetical protein
VIRTRGGWLEAGKDHIRAAGDSRYILKNVSRLTQIVAELHGVEL